MPIFNQIGIIILAGGKSSRMGQDKGLMKVNGIPMVESVIATAKKVSEQIILIANDDAYNQFGIPVFNDLYLDKGPLAGIYTGLKNSSHEYNLVLSCDIPFLHEGVAEFLISSCAGYDVTVSEYKGKIHPLIGVYRKSCLPVLNKNLLENKLKLMQVFEELKVRKLDMEDFLPENFRNINSPDDLLNG